MNLLESPLEALAFNYVSFGFFTVVNNLWTWIAFVTAAVSFWRIRVAGAGRERIFSPEESPPEEKPSPIPSPPEERLEEPQVAERLVEAMSVTSGSTKFAVYYGANGGDGELTAMKERDCDGDGDGELTVTEEAFEWFESWERVLRTRMGESETAGWYRYQDLTELNGNVVRFWDGGYYCSRSKWDSKRCVLW